MALQAEAMDGRPGRDRLTDTGRQWGGEGQGQVGRGKDKGWGRALRLHCIAEPRYLLGLKGIVVAYAT